VLSPRGGMGERLIPAVLKTVVPERVPGVRIPLPPPFMVHIPKDNERRVARPRKRLTALRHQAGKLQATKLWQVSKSKAAGALQRFLACRSTRPRPLLRRLKSVLFGQKTFQAECRLFDEHPADERYRVNHQDRETKDKPRRDAPEVLHQQFSDRPCI
jgi:hypothetical protein